MIEIVPARLQADCSHVALLLSDTDPLDLPWLKDAAQVATPPHSAKNRLPTTDGDLLGRRTGVTDLFFECQDGF